MGERDYVCEGEREEERRGEGILKMQQWGAGQGFTVIRWQNDGRLEMRERGHTQCHCRRVICKCQSLACQGKSKKERGRRRVADGGEEKEGKNRSALAGWKSQEIRGFGGESQNQSRSWGDVRWSHTSTTQPLTYKLTYEPCNTCTLLSTHLHKRTSTVTRHCNNSPAHLLGALQSVPAGTHTLDRSPFAHTLTARVIWSLQPTFCYQNNWLLIWLSFSKSMRQLCPAVTLANANGWFQVQRRRPETSEAGKPAEWKQL